MNTTRQCRNRTLEGQCLKDAGADGVCSDCREIVYGFRYRSDRAKRAAATRKLNLKGDAKCQ